MSPTSRLAAVAFVALVAAGCNGRGASATLRPTPDALASAIDDLTSLGDCKNQLGPFLTALTEVDSRLKVGPSLVDYSERLLLARVVYDAIDFNALTGGCTEAVGVPLEDAYDLYVESLTTWNDCVRPSHNSGCTVELIQPGMQTKWTDAGAKIAAARTALGR